MLAFYFVSVASETDASSKTCIVKKSATRQMAKFGFEFMQGIEKRASYV